MRLKKTTIIQLIVDSIILVIVGIPFLVVHLKVNPFWSGFFCNDQSLMYPLKDDTVSMTMNAAVGLAIAVLSFIIIELVKHSRSLSEKKMFQPLWEFGKVTFVFLVGCGVTMVIIETAKLAIGRPRPHFMEVCKPDYNRTDCHLRYTLNYNCTNQELSAKVRLEARKSFPSGHSGFSVFCAFFLCVYYQQRLKHLSYSYLLKVLLQIIVVLLATFVCMSRVSDYKHHWSDVLGGGVLGFLVGIWAVLSFGKTLNFFCHQNRVVIKDSAADLTQSLSQTNSYNVSYGTAATFTQPVNDAGV